MPWQIFLNVVILASTLSLVIWGPKSNSIFGFYALGGALLTLATGVTNLASFPAFAWVVLANTTFTLVGLIGVSWILQQTGIFRWLGLRLAYLPLGNGPLLFVILLLITSAIASIFTNYGAVLLFLPIVIELLVLLRFSSTETFAFVFAVGLIADTSSLPLTISNLVNTITASSSSISFSNYAGVMFPVNLVAIAATIAVLLFYFWPSIPPRYQPFDLTRNGFQPALPARIINLPKPEDVGQSSSAEKRQNFPSISTFFYRKNLVSKASKIAYLLFHPFFQIVLFSWGTFVLILGINNNFPLTPLQFLLTQIERWGLALTIVATGFIASFTSAIFTNLPTALIDSLAIQLAPITETNIREAAIYANVIGCAIAAKITPIGSLSALFWFYILKSRGIQITWWNYCRLSFTLILPIWFVTILSLIIWLSWLQVG